MQRDKRQAPFVNIGSSLLLVVFLVLCLVTFATLSLSSAQSDYSFSSRAAQPAPSPLNNPIVTTIIIFFSRQTAACPTIKSYTNFGKFE